MSPPLNMGVDTVYNVGGGGLMIIARQARENLWQDMRKGTT